MYFRNIAMLILLIGGVLIPQSLDSLYNNDPDPDEYLSISEAGEDTEMLILIEDLKEKPINLNTATIQNLRVIPSLSNEYAEALIKYRDQNGHIFSTAELYIIKDIPDNVIRKILPYLTIIKNEAGQINRYSDLKLNFRTRFRKSNSDYQDWGNLNRVKLSLGDKVLAGILTEKDQGEKSYTDFSSGFIEIRDLLVISSLIIGDFNIESGQGLLFWGPYSIPKGSEVISAVYKKARGINHYASSNESAFFRGIATNLNFGRFNFLTFYSFRRLDASLDSLGNITRFVTDGYHRTSGELKRKNSVKAGAYGINLNFNSDLISAGFSYKDIEFSHAYYLNKNLSGFTGHFDLSLSSLNFFGEISFLANSPTLIAGINIPFEGIDFITTYRKYEPSFKNFNSNVFAEKQSMNKKETGFYSGLRTKTALGELSVCIDQYTLPQNNYGTFKGYDIIIGLNKRFKGRMILDIRYKLDSEDDFFNNSFTRRNKQNLRSDIRWENGSILLKLRGEFVQMNIKHNLSERGILLMQELKYSFSRGISFSFKTAYFKTGSYYSAVYQYESGIPGLLENKVLFGEGLRVSVYTKFSFNNLPAFYFKYSETMKNSAYAKSYPELIFQAELNYD